MPDLVAPHLNVKDDELRVAALRVCELVKDAGGRAWLVGGGVRDSARGLGTRDVDIEVFGLSPDALRGTLGSAFELDLVGQSFGILKLKHLDIDVGLPRRESKRGEGHRGFTVRSDPFLDLPAAAARRDFTINAVYFDPLSGEVQDPFAGLDDLRRGFLRHTSVAFAEDPLRVLRGMQLAARFDLTAVPETIALCRGMDLEGLASARIFGEWRKLVLMGERPSRGLVFLAQTTWLRFFPELDALRGVPQEPLHHPEGDVWTHTGHAMDAFAAERLHDGWEDLVVGLAVLCHDLGKAQTTFTDDDGRIRSLGHEQAGVKLTRSLLGRMTDQRRLLAAVTPLVLEHGHPSQLFDQQSSAAAVRRLAVRVGRIDRLVRVARADSFGRPPLPRDLYPAGDWLLAQARELGIIDHRPEPLVRGRHLVALGAAPGCEFSTVLERCYEAQLAGDIMDEAAGIALARRLLAGS